jgi:hypothetical protein
MARPAKRLSESGEDKLELEKLLASGVAQVRVVLREANQSARFASNGVVEQKQASRV